MSDDAPLEPTEPEPVTDAVTEPVTASAADPTQPAPVAADGGPPPWPTPAEPAAATAATATTPPPAKSSTVAVPKWLLAVVGAIVVALIGFGIGYAVGDNNNDDSAAVRLGPNSGFVPLPNGNGFSFGNGNGGGNANGGNGNRSGTPRTTPRARGEAGFLGVAATRSTNPSGAKITTVVPETPAADAGLKEGDVITKVDDRDVTGPGQLANRIGAHGQGDKVTITYVRNGTTDTVDATLKVRNAFQIPTPTPTQPPAQQ